MRARRHALSDRCRSPGQPPRHSCATKSSKDHADAAPSFGNCPRSRSRREIAPLDSSSSESVIERRRSRGMRPAPVWRLMSSAGTAEPVRMKRPGRASSVTERHAWFQSAGSVCHSSIKRGESPARTSAGSMATARRARASSSSSTSLAATCRAVDVLPLALAPSTTTMLADSKRSRSCESAMRPRYGRRLTSAQPTHTATHL